METPTTWFTSDTHFYHPLMAKLRGYESVEEHDNALIKLWNSQVKPGDHVYHGGDFALCPGSMIKDFTRKLNGNIYLIRGNHDSFGTSASATRGFSWIKDYHELQLGTYRFILFHYPILSWHWSRKGTIMVHGHCHNALTHTEEERGKTIDVCMRPKLGLYSAEELVYLMGQRPLISEDIPDVGKDQTILE